MPTVWVRLNSEEVYLNRTERMVLLCWKRTATAVESFQQIGLERIERLREQINNFKPGGYIGPAVGRSVTVSTGQPEFILPIKQDVNVEIDLYINNKEMRER